MFRFTPESLKRLHDTVVRISEADAPWSHPECLRYAQRIVDSKSFNKNLRALAHDVGLLGTELHGKKVLDAGCGVGFFSLIAALEGADEVAGVDVWDDAVRFAQGYMRDIVGDGIPTHIMKQDVSNLTFPENYFDLVFCR